MSYTPGPWSVVDKSMNEFWRGDGTEILAAHGRIADCGCDGLRLIETCRANARLIAAAPTLLEALRTFVDAYAKNVDPGTADLDDEQPIAVRATLGDFRKAARALREAEGT